MNRHTETIPTLCSPVTTCSIKPQTSVSCPAVDSAVICSCVQQAGDARMCWDKLSPTHYLSARLHMPQRFVLKAKQVKMAKKMEAG